MYKDISRVRPVTLKCLQIMPKYIFYRRLNFLTVSIEIMMAFRSMQLKWYNLVTNML